MGWQEYTRRLERMEIAPSVPVEPQFLKEKVNICTCRKEEAIKDV